MPSPSAANLAYVEGLYADWLEDPASVDLSWVETFEQWEGVLGGRGAVEPEADRRSLYGGAGRPEVGGHAAPPVINGYNGRAEPLPPVASADEAEAVALQHRVDMLVRNHRVRGHIAASLDPLAEPSELPEELKASFYGFTDADMSRAFVLSDGGIRGDGQTMTLRSIIEHVRATYCGDVAAQFMHIDNLQVRQWLQAHMESTENQVKLTKKEQVRILTRLTDATLFEEFIQKKFIGAKSFSLEGGETLIPLLDLTLEHAGADGIQEIVIGMAHRGRLNVLRNILEKPAAQIFREFQDVNPEKYMGGGDVKYHLGHSGNWKTRGGKKIHLSLCFNPSHLEYVNTVALGRMRAKQDRSGLHSRGERGFVTLIHGDAAFAGEGIVQETLNLSQLPGYHTGGTLHVIINNQIGFTTVARDARSGRYCTDIAKMLQIPIFHVNGEKPEAVAAVVKLAMDFRMKFKRDVVIDMYCYRRRGHNEGDEPSYTQPLAYAKIDRRPPVRETYLESLMEIGGVTRDDADQIARRRTELLEKGLAKSKEGRSDEEPAPERPERRANPRGLWSGYVGGLEREAEDPDTGVDRDTLAALLRRQGELPAGFNLHPKLKRLLRLHEEMAEGERPLDWAAGESLALATLAVERHRIRLSGQDVQRGTFSHRHAVLHDVKTGETWTPLQHLSAEQATVELYNSPLSEAGVLGFEYGFSLDYPCGLTVWEAQFGDFVNCAQPIIDQFITSAEDKWKRLSGLVMLLPHGFEGQGPEHSSARLERFLNQCAEDNVQVCNCTTPAQLFHLLRRQVKRRLRKPLIVMTPKSLLRHPRCVSSLDELAEGRFRRVLRDHTAEGAALDGPDPNREKPDRILLCSGKIYYELLEQREKLGRQEVPILRLEQLYPFPVKELTEVLEPYGDDLPVVWVQEEPRNMGAWQFLKGGYGYRLLHRWDMTRVARVPSASPATGSRAAHQIEQARLLDDAFGDEVLHRFSTDTRYNTAAREHLTRNEASGEHPAITDGELQDEAENLVKAQSDMAGS
ncbi:2-oxoglutarate dehydrogenase E1 component [Phycisphaera mikurensis]|uniref:oxoglutarate dehydrogenase (succinyl-transferring) n=1 Tax=Phycisphaera mikurensis (strain NBRC 102666 / KCTC 22515 / FYK2301M01) TaxID=1142394 RepID=I0IB60_PHYMF|nr:2-oxoglutarate dehydrogenase E1 component [Phycisphaera mikurensis]MBB6442998.1 2-oxoglutarate dehydrogenase E1 component [Phycisphaera mikurensis]BAM02498.1 putative 2-oxoglutarate dehydrogenase E1 component [Phycisphaera mikurensis NBRC 102666]